MDPKALKALTSKHPDHAGLIVDMFADGKTEVEILAAIEKAQTANLAAKMTDLVAKAEKERNDHKAAMQASADQISKLTSDLAAANKVAALGKQVPSDVGGDATDELASKTDSTEGLEAKWNKDSKVRALFFNDKAAYMALGSLKNESITGVEGSAVSMAPKINPDLWTPINHKNVEKEG